MQSVKDILEQAVAEAKFSPDMADLEDYQAVGLFVHDELKRDKTLFNGYEVEHRGTAYTRQPFAFWQTVDSEVHAVALDTPKERVAIPRSIRGELYRVPPDLLLDVLDKRYKNRYDFNRIRVTLTIPHVSVWDRMNQKTTIKNISVRAHMYVGNPEVWGPKLEQALVETKDDFGRTHIKRLRPKVNCGAPVDTFRPVDHFSPKQNSDRPDYYYFK